jgi:UDP-glucose 4-epimerase
MLALKYLTKNKKNDCFNLGIRKGVSVRDVILSCQGVTGEKINAIDGKRREVDTSILVASSDKARKILGWKPKYTEIDSIIKTAWNWHRNNL